VSEGLHYTETSARVALTIATERGSHHSHSFSPSKCKDFSKTFSFCSCWGW